MKIYAIMTLLLSLLMLFLPFAVLYNTNTEKKPLSAINVIETDESVRVLNTSSGKVEEISSAEYLIGVVAAEMPASFEPEALKAQAVASYTYQKYLKENSEQTADFDITDSSLLHQGYLSEDQRKELWQDKFESYNQKITDAVKEVYGEYLSYDGKTALTLYHAISPGVTADCEEVFDKNLAYLQSVIAPGDRLSPDFISEKTFSAEEIKKLLKEHDYTISDDTDFSLDVSENENGYAQTVKIMEINLSADEVRKIFSLNSAFFEIEESKASFSVTVYGKGHGVGMSQYSADYMARQGSSYKDILKHFYKGAEISE